MKLSIITVSYNSESTIERTIKSVINQEVKEMEYIIIDGNSSDQTVDILRSYEEKFKQKNISFKWISEKDRGIYDAMNKGIEMASGEYILLLNSDDWYEDNVLLDALESLNVDDEIVYFNIYKVINNDIKVKSFGNIDLNNLSKLSLNHPGMMVKKEIYLKNGLYSLNYPIAGDREFVIRNLKLGTKFRREDIFLTNFSLEGESNQFGKLSKNIARIKEEYSLLKNHKISKNVILSIILKKIRTIFGNYFLIKLFGEKKSKLLFERRMQKKFLLERKV